VLFRNTSTGDTWIETISNAGTLGNVISGTGSLQQNGTGTLKLTAVNTYTGGTCLVLRRLPRARAYSFTCIKSPCVSSGLRKVRTGSI
jgi:CobQ-like glutamine amidotransferase family enzyme